MSFSPARSAKSAGPSIGDTVGGKYRLTRLIGQGGMGTVYEAQDLGLGRGVAVKFLQPRVAHDFGLVERFMREAKATAAIAHPRIVDVFDVGWTDDGQLPYFVMELLDGKNLTAELRATGPMSVDRAVGIVVQVLDALEAAHGKGFIHRDLKPENIFIIRHGLEEDVKVLDFGITKSISGQESASLTHTGAVLGTPAYMSPEQARGLRDIDHRTDLYAAGAILYELITGRPPYEGETYNEIIIKIATQDPPSITSLRPGVHPALAGVIHRALAREPEKRWPSCAAMAQALHEVLDDVHTSTGILTEHDPGESTGATPKPTPTAWEVTAPSPLPKRGSRPSGSRPPPLEETTDSDPDERTKALVQKIQVASPATEMLAWKSSPVVREASGEASSLALADETSSMPETEQIQEDTSSMPVPEDTSSIPVPEDTSSLSVPEGTALTGSISAMSAMSASRTRTFVVLAVVGLMTGAGTYLVGGWVIDGGSPETPEEPVSPARSLPLPEPVRPTIPSEPPLAPRIEPSEPVATAATIAPTRGAPLSAAQWGGTAAPPVPIPPPEPECRIRATVTTLGATVLLDGSRADPEIDLPSTCGRTHTLEVRAPGHVRRSLELTARRDPDWLRVELDEEPPPPVAPAAPRANPPRGGNRGKRGGNPRLEPNPF